MDTLTLALTHAVLDTRSVRGAARRMHRAPSTVSGALMRMEAATAIRFIRREGVNLVLTVEAEQRAASIAETVDEFHKLLVAIGWNDVSVPSLSIESLLRFSVIAHMGSIRGAARSLGIGQPQLTRQMADLERTLGASLLERARTGAGLTPLGLQVLPHIEGVVAGWEAISRASSERFHREIRTWHIGTVVPMGHESNISSMLADLIVEWSPQQKRHPLRISSHTADELIAGLKARRFDLVVLDHSHVPPDFQSVVVSLSPLALVGDASVMRDGLSIQDMLAQRPLALPSRKSGIRQETMRYLETQMGVDFTNRIEIIEVDSIPVIINLVVKHGYLSVLPQASLSRLPFPLTHISLAPDYMQRLVMVWRPNGLPDALVDAVHRSTLAQRNTES